MKVKSEKPEISKRFDLDDIRAIRDYDAARFEDMSKEEIIADTKAAADATVKRMRELKKKSVQGYSFNSDEPVCVAEEPVSYSAKNED